MSHEGTLDLPSGGLVRIAAMSDVHCKETSRGRFRPIFQQAAERADILLICGDLTDYGLPEEARVFVEELTEVIRKVPVLAVLGNHDFEAGKQDEVRRIVCDAGVVMLDGSTCEICCIGFTGVKGFGGGFGPRALQPWGEDTIKEFVRAAMNEAVKLESGLAKLQSERRVAVLHYSPVQGTVEGEPPEIFPFLGSSRLEEPLNRFGVSVVFHGHAHRGSPEARTGTDIPVYNVAVSVLSRAFPDRPPFRMVEIPVAGGIKGSAASQGKLTES